MIFNICLRLTEQQVAELKKECSVDDLVTLAEWVQDVVDEEFKHR